MLRPKGSRYILGLTGSKVLVFSADPFRYLYTLEDDLTTSFESFSYEIPFFPDGRNWLYIHTIEGKGIYDLDTGKRISEITDPKQGYDMEITPDGSILTSLDMVPVVRRPEDAAVIAEIPGVEEDSPELFGNYDEATGRRSADAVRISSMVYVYNEKEREVPDDLEGRVKLARELLNGRALTGNERKTYSLELAEEENTDGIEPAGEVNE